ncbi:uncharacterized protein JN550_007067 [Neoarthrinium moseri]|uniref:uncharacterized protein n=1 Tax=Neoarthrinium moseri TaxID=1658444 RepID=UPI001FDD7EA6|nr:uncharacterized protein JN550_007067 [Neoarthrinium moseri]KAI1867336.1 hypothetical protein JN550_007067 [Neoarthrinium moseri]
MRLFNVCTRNFEEFFDTNTPPYGILSHTWEKEEVSFHEVHQFGAVSKAGFRKIERFFDVVLKAGLTYAWVDTCCIDKTSSAELSEAINSMFKWYEKSALCFAYLSDVPGDQDPASSPAFTNSRWFKRGWTLQELLAPPQVMILGSDWSYIGNRDLLAEPISAITGIGSRYLTTREAEIHYRGSSELFVYDFRGHLERIHRIHDATIAEKLSWAATRQTTREEDIAYCLLGLCAVNMPLLYGEGTAAFQRLQEAIIRRKFDPTLLAWNVVIEDSTGKRPLKPERCRRSPGWSSIGKTLLGIEDPWSHPNGDEYRPLNFSCPGILATSPICFSQCDQYVNFEATLDWDLTSRGLSIKLPTSDNINPYMLLPCHRKDDQWNILAIPLIGFEDGSFDRAAAPVEFFDRQKWQMWPWRLLSLSTYAPAWDWIRESYTKVMRIHADPELQLLDVTIANEVSWLSDGMGIRWFANKARQRLLQILVKSRTTETNYIIELEASMIKAGELRALLPESTHLRFNHSVRQTRQIVRLNSMDVKETDGQGMLQRKDAPQPLLVTTSQVMSANDAEYLLHVSEPGFRQAVNTDKPQETNFILQKYNSVYVSFQDIAEGTLQKLAVLTDNFEVHVPRTVRRLLSDLWTMTHLSLIAIFPAWSCGLISPSNLPCDLWCWFLCTRTYKLLAWAGIVHVTVYQALPVTCYLIPKASQKIARYRGWIATLCIVPIFSDVVVLPGVRSGVVAFVVGVMGSLIAASTGSNSSGLYFTTFLIGFAIGFSLPYLTWIVTVPPISAGAMAVGVGLVELWIFSINAQNCSWFTILWLYTSVFVFLEPMYTEMADCQLNPFALLVEDGIRRYQQSLYGQQLYGHRQKHNKNGSGSQKRDIASEQWNALRTHRSQVTLCEVLVLTVADLT